MEQCGKEEDDMLKKVLQKQNGMMTVEAAVIVPLICFVFIGIIFLFLFFVDMAIAQSEGMRIASEISASWKTDGSLTTGEYDPKELLTRNIYFLVTGKREKLTMEAQNRLQDRLKKRLLVTKIEDSTAYVESWRVRVQTTLRLQWPLRSVEEIMGKWLSFSCTVDSFSDCWEEQLRLGASMECK